MGADIRPPLPGGDTAVDAQGHLGVGVEHHLVARAVGAERDEPAGLGRIGQQLIMR